MKREIQASALELQLLFGLVTPIERHRVEDKGPEDMRQSQLIVMQIFIKHRKEIVI